MSPVVSLTDAEDGAATVLSYVLLLGVATVLMTGLIVAGSAMADNQQQRTVGMELTVIGEQLSGDISTVDRMARTPVEIDTARLDRQFPQTVSGNTYRMNVTDDPDIVGTDVALELQATGIDQRFEAPIHSKTDVAVGSNATGGAVVIYYDEDDEEVVIEDA